MNVKLRAVIAGVGIWWGATLFGTDELAWLVLLIGAYNLGVLTAIAEEARNYDRF